MSLHQRSIEMHDSSNDLSNILSTKRGIRRVKSSTLSLASLKSPSGTKKNSQMEELQCLAMIKRTLRKLPVDHFVSNELMYRFAAFHNFDAYAAVEGIVRDVGNRHLSLKMTDELLEQFHTATLFPLPEVRAKSSDCNVLYMRPSRYFPSTETRLIIDNLCYALNDMSKTKADCRKGVAFIANMDGWTKKNFSHDYCFQFMQALQGRMVPTKVKLFLIVNPPKFFGSIWKIMKPMLSKSFAKKVHIIKEDRLGEFLMDGYQEYLPDEFACGARDAFEICEDFIDLKRYEEEQEEIANAKSISLDRSSFTSHTSATTTAPLLLEAQSDGFGRLLPHSKLTPSLVL